MQATYLRSRRNVHSLASPLWRQRRERIRPDIFLPKETNWFRERWKERKATDGSGISPRRDPLDRRP